MADAPITVGNKAPAFTLADQNGEKVKLTDLTGQWVVLYFYPKDDTPGCTKEACEFTEGLEAFEGMNAKVLGCSPDSPDKHQKFIDKYDLQLTLLSDPEKKVMTKYGAFGEKKSYGKTVQGVIRSTVLIDPQGKVAHHWRNVKAAGHAEKVRQKLEELQG
jgi:peroxiredoxin Q/BCP